MKRGKKMLNANLERHMARPHALSHEVSTFIYREMICLQYFHNIFITNFRWQVVTGCYC